MKTKHPASRSLLVASFAALALLPWALATATSGQEQHKRRSIDPPLASRGKLGQDLFLAIDHRDTAAVKSLLGNGADPNSQNGLEFSPLYIAAASHQNEVVDILLNAGAKVDLETTYGSALTFACATGNIVAAKTLIGKGADVNMTRTDGITPLMMAANAGSADLVKELIKSGANVVSKNENGSSALTYAARNGHAEVVAVLLDSGVDADQQNKDGETPLIAAATNGHVNVVRLLIENGGADTNFKNAKGQTALTMVATYGDYPSVVSELLKAGADQKATNPEGRTAAQIAGQRGHVETAKLLRGKIQPVKTTPEVAARKGIKLMESSMKSFNERTNCISCHQEGLGRMATASAKERGIALDPATHGALEGRLNGALGFMKPIHEAALKDPDVMKQLPLIEINEVNTGDSWLLAGMAANNEKPDGAKAAMAMVLAKQQSPAGFWSFSMPRFPMQSSFFTVTALAVRSVKTYAPESAKLEVQDRVDRAKDWMLKTQPKSSEDRASRLMGLKWAGASETDLKAAAKLILADQRPDGGWSQNPMVASDAYATGQALYALRVAGAVKTTDAAYKRGVQYLLRTQDSDGSWYVVKRAMPANNYFDGGFPHGESQYASFNGTSWAVMALLETLPKK